MHFWLRAINAVLRAVLATIGGMLLFVWMVLFTVFVVPAVVLFVVVMGALLIVACAGLAFWVFTGDPNALRGFFMACLFGGAPFGAFALVRHICIEIGRARKPKDAPFVELPAITVEPVVQPPALAHVVSPWMRSRRIPADNKRVMELLP